MRKVFVQETEFHHDQKYYDEFLLGVYLKHPKTRLASKYNLETSPRLVDIIAAVPSQYKKAS